MLWGEADIEVEDAVLPDAGVGPDLPGFIALRGTGGVSWVWEGATVVIGLEGETCVTGGGMQSRLLCVVFGHPHGTSC